MSTTKTKTAAEINTNAEIEKSKVIASSSSNIILWILVGTIVIFVILGIIFFVIKPYIENKSPASYQLEYQPFAFWSAASKTTDYDRNFCNLYQFQGIHDKNFDPVEGVNHLIPAQTSVSASIVDGMSALPAPSCYDVDQLILVKGQHTCIKLSSLEEGDFIGVNASGGKGVSFCTEFNGDRADIGATEEYYADGMTYLNSYGDSQVVSCGQLPCMGTIGLIGLGYRVRDYSNPKLPVSIMPVQNTTDGYEGMKCIIKDSYGSLSVSVCDGTNQGQIFRILRQQYGVPMPPPSDTRKSGTYGNTALIVDRSTSSTCLNYDADTNSIVFNDQCTVYNWGLFNSMNTATKASPQQIVYIGSLTSDEKKNLFLQKNPDDIWSVIEEYGLYSLVLDQTSTTIGFEPFYTYDPSAKTNEIGLHGSQLVDYTLFNNICFGTTQVGF